MDLLDGIALLAAAVIFVPLFKRLGLGSVLGYLAGGLVVGPFGLKLFEEPEEIVHFAELGVVLLLFLIGLEMKPSRLWSLRKEIFGLGVTQVVLCGLLMTGAAILLGFSPAIAFIGAMGFVLTSTAIVIQILSERGETSTPSGQKIVSILLLEDLAIVPLLAAAAFLNPNPIDLVESQPRWVEILISLAAILGLVAVARYLLNPIFRIFAAARAREIMTAAALLVVLGAAEAMDYAGLSMATGAFLAGVILSESSFRHELEADIEPFRGLLLGLFFLGVGMSLDLFIVTRDWMMLAILVAAFIAVKGVGIYVVARIFRSDHDEAIRRTVLMAQGGEFAFVLYAAAVAQGVAVSDTMALFTAAVIISMILTPILVVIERRLLPAPKESFDGIEAAEGLSGTALVIGFGRFGQVVSQHLLAGGVDVTIIDLDTDMIRNATRFGFKIYYGDGTRLDVLRAAGAGTARVIAVCTDGREPADKIVELVKSEFPLAALNVRSFDRGHTLDLVKAGVDYEMRETFESAMAFGEATLRTLGVEPEDAREIAEDVRRRDLERLELQMAGGLLAGRGVLRTTPTPTPLILPKRETKTLTEETAEVAKEAARTDTDPTRV
jgi:glutathione-regulated potassium-efflux system protein KefB